MTRERTVGSPIDRDMQLRSIPFNDFDPTSQLLAGILQARGLATIEIVRDEETRATSEQLCMDQSMHHLFRTVQRRPDFKFLAAVHDPLSMEPKAFRQLGDQLEPLNPINPVMRTRVVASYWSARAAALETLDYQWDESPEIREQFNDKRKLLRQARSEALQKNNRMHKYAAESESGEYQELGPDDESLLVFRILNAAMGASLS